MRTAAQQATQYKAEAERSPSGPRESARLAAASRRFVETGARTGRLLVPDLGVSVRTVPGRRTRRSRADGAVLSDGVTGCSIGTSPCDVRTAATSRGGR